MAHLGTAMGHWKAMIILSMGYWGLWWSGKGERLKERGDDACVNVRMGNYWQSRSEDGKVGIWSQDDNVFFQVNWGKIVSIPPNSIDAEEGFSSFIHEDTCLLLISGLLCFHTQVEYFSEYKPFWHIDYCNINFPCFGELPGHCKHFRSQIHFL